MPLKLTAEAYLADAPVKRAVGAGATALEVRLGEHLYVQLVLIKPDRKVLMAFPGMMAISYDLFLSDGSERQGKRASVFEGLIERASVCLSKRSLPEVVLGAAGRLTIKSFFGSCRKLGGIGRDASSALLDEIAAQNLLNRPNHLFLIGDQVYGDDIPEPVAVSIFRLAARLGGTWSIPPVKDFGKKYGGSSVRGPATALNDRGNTTGFTADADTAANHLMTEYEYAALHCLAWNDALWNSLDPLFAATKSSADRSEKQQALLSQVEQFRKDTRATRALLANTPTYMLFDDHDVTDDWNLDIAWRRNLLPFGQRIVGAALAVYTMFQHWGNTADVESSAGVREVQDCFSRRGTAAATPSVRPPDLADLAGIFLKKSWSYAVSSSPSVICLDTRTKREAAAVNQLVTVEFLDQLLPVVSAPRVDTVLFGAATEGELRELALRHNDAMIIATPAPVFSHAVAERLKGIVTDADIISALSKTAIYKYDIEDWLANPESLLRFIRCLASMKPATFVVLAGDVHFSYSLRATVAVGSRKFSIVQFCSSALCNEHPRWLQNTVRGLDWARKSSSLWWWNQGDSTAGYLDDPDQKPLQKAMLDKKFAGKMLHRIDLEVFPMSWYPPEARTPSLEFANSVGRLYATTGRLQGMHLSTVGTTIRKSRTVDLVLGAADT